MACLNTAHPWSLTTVKKYPEQCGEKLKANGVCLRVSDHGVPSQKLWEHISESSSASSIGTGRNDVAERLSIASPKPSRGLTTKPTPARRAEDLDEQALSRYSKEQTVGVMACHTTLTGRQSHPSSTGPMRERSAGGFAWKEVRFSGSRDERRQNRQQWRWHNRRRCSTRSSRWQMQGAKWCNSHRK